MGDDIIALLNAHQYFRGISDDTLREITSIAQVSNYATGAVVHQLDEPLTSICFVLRGRLKAVRVDTRGEEQFFRMFERGEQYGIMLGSLGEALPVRVFALEPSTILSLNHEAAMELMFQHAALRRQWLQTYAGSIRQHFFEACGWQKLRTGQAGPSWVQSPPRKEATIGPVGSVLRRRGVGTREANEQDLTAQWPACKPGADLEG